MIGVGLIGCGVIGPTHIEAYQKLPNVKIVHISDLVPEKMQEKGDKYNIVKRSQNYHDLLADPEVDLVSVCTDHASHVQIVCDAIAAGKHVFCEKSPGRVMEDLDKMVAAAASHPELVVSGVFQGYRGTLQSIDDEKKQVMILASTEKREIPIFVDIKDIRVAE